MKTLDKYVIMAALYIILWSVAFFVSWLVKGEEPSVLEGCILAPGVVELICTAFIQHGKNHEEATNGQGEISEEADE